MPFLIRFPEIVYQSLEHRTDWLGPPGRVQTIQLCKKCLERVCCPHQSPLPRLLWLRPHAARLRVGSGFLLLVQARGAAPHGLCTHKSAERGPPQACRAPTWVFTSLISGVFACVCACPVCGCCCLQAHLGTPPGACPHPGVSVCPSESTGSVGISPMCLSLCLLPQ